MLDQSLLFSITFKSNFMQKDAELKNWNIETISVHWILMVQLQDM